MADRLVENCRREFGLNCACAVGKPGDFVVTSILLNQPPIAVINGKEMVEGEVVAMNFGGQKVNVQLTAVQDGQVILRYQDQNLVVPLRRREIKPFGGPTATR